MLSLIQDCVTNMLTSTKSLKQILEETGSVLKMFWRAVLPGTETTAAQQQKVRMQSRAERPQTPDTSVEVKTT